MALPPLDQILALFPDNTSGDISAADQRSMITDLYTQIAANLTADNGKANVAGDTFTGDVIHQANVDIQVANFLRFTAGQAVLASLNVDIASNLEIDAVNNLTLDSQRLLIDEFNNAANLGKVLSVGASGRILATQDSATTILTNLMLVAITLPAGSVLQLLMMQRPIG